MTRVLVIAEIRLYREGLARAVARRRDYVVAGTAARADEAVLAMDRDLVDVALVDASTSDGKQAIVRIAALSNPPKIIAIGVRDDAEVVACAEAGVAGYVTRDEPLAALLTAVDSVAQGEMRCSPRVAALLMRRVGTLASKQLKPASLPHLTRRELEIVDLIDQGLSNKLIAARLGIELSTVKNHVHNILEKLHVSGRSAAAARVRTERAAERR